MCQSWRLEPDARFREPASSILWVSPAAVLTTGQPFFGWALEMRLLASRLIDVTEGRDFPMHARIGVLRALNRNVERVLNQSRKDTHWGKRKLKREL
jgi:hypothetical protein